MLSPYLYLLPALAMLLGYMYVPLLRSVQYSFFEFREFRPDAFVGFTNYIHVFQDGLFWNSVSLTLQWVAMTALLPSVSGLILALLIEYSGTGRVLAGVTRTILFMPMMMSLVAVGLLWMLIFNPNLGLINALLNALSITDPGNPVNLFGNVRYALFSAFIPVLWQGSGFAMVIFSAALQSLPLEIREASVIDGANKLRQIRSIVLRPQVDREYKTQSRLALASKTSVYAPDTGAARGTGNEASMPSLQRTDTGEAQVAAQPAAHLSSRKARLP